MPRRADDEELALGVIGAAVLDRIFPYAAPVAGEGSRRGAGGEPVRSMGGITYSLHALAALAPHPSSVVPALNLGADAASFVRAELAALGVDTRFLRTTAAIQNAVELRYATPEHRQEVLRGGVPPLPLSALGPFLSEIDALYVNFVAGNELTPAGVRLLRCWSGGPVYADLHSLLLGRARSGLRYYRPLANWREWVSAFDLVQCNAEEAAMLAASPRPAGGEGASPGGRPARGRAGAEGRPQPSRRGRPAGLPPPLDSRGTERLAREVLELGPRLFVLTSGAGPLRAWTSEGARWRLAARPPGPVRDPTGCGDVLGAAFCALHFLHDLPLRVALERAARVAAWKATRIGTEGLAAALSAWYLQRHG